MSKHADKPTAQKTDTARKKPGSKGGAVLGDINRDSKAEPDDKHDDRDHRGNIISELNHDKD